MAHQSHQDRHSGKSWSHRCTFLHCDREMMNNHLCLREKKQQLVSTHNRVFLNNGCFVYLLSWQYVPVNPGWQAQVKFFSDWLMQRPWAPQTLNEMCRTPFTVSFDVTAIVQLSITNNQQNTKQHSMKGHLYKQNFKADIRESIILN